MNQNDGPTVSLRGSSSQPVAEEVTVCLPGSALAPAPSALVTRAVRLDEVPVFVDDSGTRQRLLRLVGVIVALLSLGFLTLVGVAVAVPSVATSVGLDGVVPFLVPGAAAKPPPAAPVAPIAHAVPRPRVRKAPVVVRTQPPTTTHSAHAPAPAPAPVTDDTHRTGNAGSGTGDDTDGKTDGTATDGTTGTTTGDTTTGGTTTTGITTGDTTTGGTTTTGTTTGGTTTTGTTATDGTKTIGTAPGTPDKIDAEHVLSAPANG